MPNSAAYAVCFTGATLSVTSRLSKRLFVKPGGRIRMTVTVRSLGRAYPGIGVTAVLPDKVQLERAVPAKAQDRTRMAAVVNGSAVVWGGQAIGATEKRLYTLYARVSRTARRGEAPLVFHAFSTQSSPSVNRVYCPNYAPNVTVS